MSAYRLDVPELHRLLDAKRRERGMTWRAVARAAGLNSSTLHRVTQGHKPDADGLLSLLAWVGADAMEVAAVGAPPEQCDTCRGIPPTGFACLVCGAEGTR